ncbi:dynamin family protein [Burkholderia cepacia]|uniref:Dynamin N-terminal domain-containing protein n=1 Tax=Burkholderia cepacia TaxID=292 RepID=A0AAQ0FCW8_BURCE|nr:dynamin family protein [Burkholderia cepacia]MCE4129852.1 dynamin family protein [Burkholderia cepacia]MDN7856283.1 dynamin family protein [Burkholderia cepacia]RAQ05970.1 hypothetical protein DPR02_22630 [Burkholderia cepacia]
MDNTQQESVQLILARLASRWRSVADDIARITGTLRDAIGASWAGLGNDVESHIDTLRDAVGIFEAAALEPEVVIATTGTTSSGKSTLANMLIGDALLPKAVQEMSAGVVIVRHDDARRRLVIEDTRGATWTVGEWDALSAQDVRQRLEATMKAYRDRVTGGADGDGAGLEPPRIHITWPTNMGLRHEEFGLPRGSRLTIIDLPGLKYVNDDLNGAVMRQYARKALCFVAYNSLETDPRKQEALLRQVVDQVKQLGGSPARMLFVLNRIDAYRTDENPEESERSFTDHVTQQIRKGVIQALPEYAGEAAAIEPVALSSEPALYAVLADALGRSNDEAVLRKLAKEYATLFSDSELDALPRAPSDWSDSQRRWFLGEARYQSRLELFQSRLASHLKSNLPELLIPDLVDGAYVPARAALEGIDALVEAYQYDETSKIAEIGAKLEALHQRLKAVKKEALIPLNPLTEAANGDGDLIDNLSVAVPHVEAKLGLGGANDEPGKLSALSDAPMDAVNGPLFRLLHFLNCRMNGEVADDVSIESVPSFIKLDAALDQLHEGPYAKHWRSGGKFEAAEAKQVRDAMSEFGRMLSTAASELIERESVIQAARMSLALEACAAVIVERTEADASAVIAEAGLPGLQGVFRGPVDIVPLQLPRVPFSPTMTTWRTTERQQVEETEYVEKRVWWKLWIGKSQVEQKRMVMRETMREGIEVASFEQVLEGFSSTITLGQFEIYVGTWIRGALSRFDALLDERLKDGIKIYRNALEQRLAEVEEGARTRIDSVGKYRDVVRQTLETVECSRRWRGAC